MNTFKDKLSRLMICFTAYCFAGWIYEMVLSYAHGEGWQDRSEIYGPFCMIYGFGVVLLIVCFAKGSRFYDFFENKVLRVLCMFIGIILVTTAVELIGSYISEALTGGFMWNYNKYSFDFDGRIAPYPSLRFGIVGTVVLCTIQPLIDKIIEKMPDRARHIIALGLLAFFVINILLSKLA